ncbi:MAG TPA: DUF2272 domain-containing protein, partial [Chitinophagaceae bacterium]
MASSFAKRLAAKAEDQYNKFHLYNEGDPPLSAQIKKYWQGLGLHFPGVGEQWSAVFVSWCIKSTGATAAEFKFAQRHAIFLKWAIKNSVDQVGLFRAHRISQYSPSIGDIVVNNQPSGTYDYDYAASNDSYHSHSAIVTERGQDKKGEYVLTVGGNESDSVRQKIIYLKNG